MTFGGPSRLRARFGGLLAAGMLVGTAGPATAVVVLDSAWQAAGGAPGRESAGFGFHIALAAQRQFDSLMALSEDEGETWGAASGTWLGNDRGHGYVLTAAHVFEDDYGADDYLYRSQGGTIYQGEAVVLHPRWNGNQDERTGFDFAIVRLRRPVTDAGAPPVLYAGRDELGRIGTMVGFGSRGIGSVGEREAYYEGDDKAAAQNMIDDVSDIVWPPPEEADESAGNEISVDFDQETGTAENTYGDALPAGDFEGALGSGDSGGSLWVEFPGGWRLVGVNASGTADTYGGTCHFGRVATQLGWIRKIFSGVRAAP